MFEGVKYSEISASKNSNSNHRYGASHVQTPESSSFDRAGHGAENSILVRTDAVR